jgi:alpha-D-xyloside xylohydrolase
MQLADRRQIQHHIFAQTTLGVGESVHGFGERFWAFKVGQCVARALECGWSDVFGSRV